MSKISKIAITASSPPHSLTSISPIPPTPLNPKLVKKEDCDGSSRHPPSKLDPRVSLL